MPTTGEASLYFHIPFCSKKCPYCHFFVLPNEQRYKDPFFEALQREWHLVAPKLQDKKLVSIYFGGGTPTKLSPASYAQLLASIENSGLVISSDCEITLEANPEDVSLSLMQGYKAAGINRISLGVQSLLDEELSLLGRTHGAQTAMDAIWATHAAGLTNISIDLLFDLPHQNLERFERTLHSLRSLPVTHLSLYNLTLEPHTLFFKHRERLLPTLPSDAASLALLQAALEAFASLGFHRYEISAFARPGFESRHNSGYWTARPFLGLGPSAFSYWEGARFSNTTRFNHYLDALKRGALPVAFEERLPFPQSLQELLAVRLRLTEGVHLPSFTASHGDLPPSLEPVLEKLLSAGLLHKTQGGYLSLTAQGQLFYDTVASELM
jgi:oxygen-independent coproporphyrinogen-3 oxidase